jgi:DNA-binding LytR/AlgR family response regulator
MTEDQSQYFDISYIMKLGHDSLLVLMDGKEIITEKTLTELEKILPANEFFRVHRGYIVKLEEIIEIIRRGNSYFLQLKNGLTIPVSRRRRNSLMGLLNIIN